MTPQNVLPFIQPIKKIHAAREFNNISDAYFMLHEPKSGTEVAPWTYPESDAAADPSCKLCVCGSCMCPIKLFPVSLLSLKLERRKVSSGTALSSLIRERERIPLWHLIGWNRWVYTRELNRAPLGTTITSWCRVRPLSSDHFTINKIWPNWPIISPNISNLVSWPLFGQIPLPKWD